MLTESECWAIVAEIDWGNKCKSISDDTVSRMLALRLGKEKSAALYAFVRKREVEIDRAISKWETQNNKSCGLSDDSFGDLCSHIVGLGEELFKAHVANPSLAYDRACKGKFMEKFSYCIPDANTVTSVDDSSLREWRDRTVADLTEVEQVAPALAHLASLVKDAVLAAETSDKTQSEYNALWLHISTEAMEIEKKAVGTKIGLSILSNAAILLRGWGHRNYVSDVLKIREARKLVSVAA